MRKIEINGKEYALRYTIRALFIWEQITGKPFAVNTLLDNYILFYAIILANNEDDAPSWDDFIDALDNDPSLFQRMADAVGDLAKRDDIAAKGDGDDDKKKAEG